MQELIKIQNTPALLNVNFEELKAALEKDLEKYRVVVTADTVAGAKKLATELNKTKGMIATRRKEEVAKASEPVKQFDTQMKDLEGMIENGRQDLLAQVKRFEDETRQLSHDLLEQLRDQLWEKQGIEQEFRRAEFADLVMLTTVTKTNKLTASAKGQLESRIAEDKALQDRTKMRLLELENQSYKAGLAAPLTRDHIAGFLFAEDTQYQAELDRLMAAELQREEQAKERQRKAHEAELARREAEIRAEEDRKRQIEEARIRAEEGEAIRKAMRQQEASEGMPQAVRTEEPAPYTPEPAKARPGKVALTVTATFSTEIPEHVTDDQVEAELRKVMANAGITTLAGISVQRHVRKAA